MKAQDVRIKSGEIENNNLEQYTCRNSLRLYGVPDNLDETEEQTCKKVMNILMIN